jgi:dethiobiotin synthetase
MRNLFITSVGTEIGKTLTTSILCHQLALKGRGVAALKPVVSGFRFDDPDSDPALIVRSLGQRATAEAISAISPWRFAAPLSPHLAARMESRHVDISQVASFCQSHEHPTRFLVVEGAGGLMSPLNDRATNLDLIGALGYPVVLVTGTYLGALSHTLTAHRTLVSSGVPIQAIIVSESDPSAGLSDTVETVTSFTGGRNTVIALHRLSGNVEQKWRSAPNLIDTILGDRS